MHFLKHNNQITALILTERSTDFSHLDILFQNTREKAIYSSKCIYTRIL